MSDTTSSSLIVVVELLPFEVDLNFDQFQRHLSPSAEQSSDTRDLSLNKMSIDTVVLSDKIKSYLDNYFSQAFRGKNNSYASFNSVILSMMQRRRTEQLRNNHVANEPSLSGQRYPKTRRLAADSTIGVRFGGAAVFLREGSSSVPKTTIVQSLELDALTDSDRLLLYSLQNSSYASGLSTVKSLSISIISSPPASTSTVSSQESPISKLSGINKNLIIGLTAGATALTLLAFILFIIYRRSSFNSNRGKTFEVDKIITKSSTNEMSDHDLSPRLVSPINVINVKVESSFDDNVSEYTESVYSAPKRKKWSRQPQDVESITKKQDDPSFYEKVDTESFQKYPDDEKSTDCADDGDIPRITISDRFTPRYIESSENHNDSFASDESMDVAEQLSRAHPKERSSGKKTRSSGIKMRYSGKTHDPLATDYEPGALFTENQRENILPSNFDPVETTGLHRTRDDNSTLSSSLGSFSYSIEPIGDLSTEISSKV